MWETSLNVLPYVITGYFVSSYTGVTLRHMEDEKNYLVELHIKATIIVLEGAPDLENSAVEPNSTGVPLSLLIQKRIWHLKYENSFILSYPPL